MANCELKVAQKNRILMGTHGEIVHVRKKPQKSLDQKRLEKGKREKKVGPREKGKK